MRCFPVAFVILAACGDSGGPVTLTIQPIDFVDSNIAGDGIDCGVEPACDGTQGTACTVTKDSGTQVTLTITHPVCLTSKVYSSFTVTPAVCTVSANKCSFDLDDTITLRISGVP